MTITLLVQFHLRSLISDQHFNKIYTYYNNLSSHLPSSLGLFLPNLHYLVLEDNKLSGTIPNSISNASQLTKLDLDDNSFSGKFRNHLVI